jgi:purine nucleosidase/pyrimidine-specific ribonucleoside hydrolase
VGAHAIDWIAAAVGEAPGPVTLIATAPLTNIALLLARYPEIESRLERVVLMGGAIAEGNVTPAAEFNIWVDPEAAARVFQSGLDLTMVGLDVTHRAIMTPEHAQRLAAAGRAGKLAADMYAFYARFHHAQYGWEGAPIHDPVAVAHVIDGALVHTARRAVVVDTGPDLSRGRTHVDLHRCMGWEANCHVAVEIDSERFAEMLIERIGALG